MSWFTDLVEISLGIPPGTPEKLVEAGASLFSGPGGVAGIFVTAGGFLVGGGTPEALVAATIAGAGVSQGVNAFIETRKLSAEERTLAEMIYGSSLPPHDKIILTNLKHPEGRAFTILNPAGECLINLGEAYNDPIRYTAAAYPEYGQLLIHELGHVWQIHHSSFLPGLICDGILNQVQYEMGKDVYNPGDGEKNWSEYNLEQQATIVDRWYKGWDVEPCSKKSHVYRHILGINEGKEPPVVQELSVSKVAQSKFGVSTGFSVRNRFPLYKDGSIRFSLIGLHG
jgi:hypothetical protein